MDDSVWVVGFREPQQGTREEQVGVIVLGSRHGRQWRQRSPLGRLGSRLLFKLSREQLPLGAEGLFEPELIDLRQ